jgi:hypothetical protein
MYDIVYPFEFQLVGKDDSYDIRYATEGSARALRIEYHNRVNDFYGYFKFFKSVYFYRTYGSNCLYQEFRIRK